MRAKSLSLTDAAYRKISHSDISGCHLALRGGLSRMRLARLLDGLSFRLVEQTLHVEHEGQPFRSNDVGDARDRAVLVRGDFAPCEI